VICTKNKKIISFVVILLILASYIFYLKYEVRIHQNEIAEANYQLTEYLGKLKDKELELTEYLGKLQEKEIEINELQKELEKINTFDYGYENLALAIYFNAKSSYSTIGSGVGLDLLHAYVIAQNLTIAGSYLKNESVEGLDPVIKRLQDNRGVYEIRDPFINVKFFKEEAIPFRTLNEGQVFINTSELWFVVQEDTNLPSFYFLNDHNGYDRYDLDSRGIRNYDVDIMANELLDFENRKFASTGETF